MIGKSWMAMAASSCAMAIACPAAAKQCAELASSRIDHGEVTSAEVVAAGAFEAPPSPFGPPPGVANAAYKGLPAFCRVRATLTPTPDSDIKVEVWLPAEGWNGKFVGIGNGIWAGQISYAQMAEPLARGYAVASTDTGHVGNGLTAEFAIGHPEKLVDFGHRAVHLMTRTAKQAIGDFYGKAPALSLWNSCSTGGRQGLMAAYRYPEDFDAISAMAPANPMTDLMVQSMWTGWQALRTPSAALTPEKLALAHKAVIAQCDAEDGLKDGLVSRPDICRFDPATIQCKPGQDGDCLNGDQVTALRAIYEGVRDPRSGVLLLPGFPRGSEMQMAMLTGGPAPFPVATTYFSMLVFGDQPDWDWRTMDYGADLEKARSFGSAILNVPPDGLAPFFARGGKLLLSHGWNDGLIPATNTLAFHAALREALPAQQVEDSLRLFMAPGMDHCAGGEGPSAFDTLGVIDRWASEGTAPTRIVATRGPGFPGAPAQPPMSRPLCPFPQIAKYKGTGSTDEEQNFICAPAD
ncbi:tannase/feruloyl esterase family alpha/beta hydrolase [Sphingobium lignivorans]|uniref:Feruloyl esterase n=1 Tax=Sphingobium lignivorans TaxID=2735886 RepID=A0ABR6NJS4_9SPHN|nr:tannase/feruloyl esterase family alpha/beta hydrolase [Sphingobium lignivorans]MBB5987506.1 hypothetical protein [Sphingobium lignivorans]